MKELDIEIVERDNNIPPEKSILVDQQIKNLQVLYSNIEEKYIKLREEYEKVCQRLGRMENSFGSFYDMTVHQFEACSKKFDDIETEVFPKKDAKEDIKKDAKEDIKEEDESDLVCRAFVWKDDVIELFGTHEDQQLFEMMYKIMNEDLTSKPLSKEKTVMLALDCGLSVKKKLVQ